MRTMRNRAAVAALAVSVFVLFSSSVFAKGDHYGKSDSKEYGKSYSKYSGGYDKDQSKGKHKSKSSYDKGSYSDHGKSKYKKQHKKKYYRKSHKEHHDKCIHETETCECDGKLTTLTLRYFGAEVYYLTVIQSNGDTIYSDQIEPGETFALTGTDQRGSQTSNTTLGTEISLFLSDGSETKIHTSCSVEIVTGDEFGPFRVLAGTSRNNGAICEGEPTECDPEIMECLEG